MGRYRDSDIVPITRPGSTGAGLFAFQTAVISWRAAEALTFYVNGKPALVIDRCGFGG